MLVFTGEIYTVSEDDFVRITLRIPKELDQMAEDEAKEKFISKNAVILQRMQRGYEEPLSKSDIDKAISTIASLTGHTNGSVENEG